MPLGRPSGSIGFLCDIDGRALNEGYCFSTERLRGWAPDETIANNDVVCVFGSL